MKTFLVARLAALLALFALPLGAATTPEPSSDRAADLLARHGALPVSEAGPHVQPGTFRVQVAAKLGRPDAVLPDGTWLYHRRRVADSDAQGTLVVHFSPTGRVSSLALAGPAAVAALQRNLPSGGRNDLVVTKYSSSRAR